MSASVSCVTVSDVPLTMLTTEPRKAAQGTLSIPPTVSQEFVFKQSKHTLDSTHTHTLLLPNEHSRAASHYTYLIHFPKLFSLIAHVQLRTLTHTRPHVHPPPAHYLSNAHTHTDTHNIARSRKNRTGPLKTYAPSHFFVCDTVLAGSPAVS